MPVASTGAYTPQPIALHAMCEHGWRQPLGKAVPVVADFCSLRVLLYAGNQLEKGPAALLSCFEGILRAAAPPPPPPVTSMLSPVPPGLGRRSARASSVSPARQAAPLTAPLPPDTPGNVMLEDDPPRCAPEVLHATVRNHLCEFSARHLARSSSGCALSSTRRISHEVQVYVSSSS